MARRDSAHDTGVVAHSGGGLQHRLAPPRGRFRHDALQVPQQLLAMKSPPRLLSTARQNFQSGSRCVLCHRRIGHFDHLTHRCLLGGRKFAKGEFAHGERLREQPTEITASMASRTVDFPPSPGTIRQQNAAPKSRSGVTIPRKFSTLKCRICIPPSSTLSMRVQIVRHGHPSLQKVANTANHERADRDMRRGECGGWIGVSTTIRRAPADPNSTKIPQAAIRDCFEHRPPDAGAPRRTTAAAKIQRKMCNGHK